MAGEERRVPSFARMQTLFWQTLGGINAGRNADNVHRSGDQMIRESPASGCSGRAVARKRH